MFYVLQIVTVIVVAIAMVPALAHALELPGKMKLDQEAYYTTQSIYYPGFTAAGFVEPISIVLISLIVFLTPSGNTNFWLILAALLGVIGMQVVYWLFTHPINQFWVEGKSLDRLSSGFFSFGINRSGLEHNAPSPDWTELRDRWEYSHVVRAGFALLSLIALVIAIS